MDKQTYTQQVQALAEKMAAAQYEKSFYEIQVPLMPLTRFNINSPLAQKCIKSIAPTLLPAARIAVAEIAEAVRQYAIQCAAIPALPGFTVMDYLKYQGLIPNNEPGGRQ